MQRSDLTTLTALLRALYGKHRFPGTRNRHGRAMAGALAPFDADTVRRAVRHWAHQHTNKPPSLNELVEAVEAYPGGRPAPPPPRCPTASHRLRGED